MRGARAAAFLALAFALLAILFRDPLLHGDVLGQTDLLFKFLPWSAHAPVGWRVRNPLMGDVPMQFYPWAAHARAELLAGHFPLWNTAAAAGQPFFAAVQTQVLSPFSLLNYALAFPASLTAIAPDAASGTGGDAVVVQQYQDEDVSLDARVAGQRMLVLLDTYYPGWVATVDQREVPIHRVDYAFRGVVVPAGRHIVAFHYRPVTVRAGAAVSLTSLALLGWLFARSG